MQVVGKGLECSDPCENTPENTGTSPAAKAEHQAHSGGGTDISTCSAASESNRSASQRLGPLKKHSVCSAVLPTLKFRAT